MAKTFWGWHDEQLSDGTVIWTSPHGAKYVTTPGSALILPALCVPSAPVAPGTEHLARCTDKTAMMPRRRQTRKQSQAAAIATERRRNHQLRTTPQPPPYRCDEDLTYKETFVNATDSDPPPF